ncbi:MAG TPA: hypothetical protein PKG52_00630 [bacterium]|nr:hypothetical protein [bacterium]HPS29194.1 hypothetical protein [bacterium]
MRKLLVFLMAFSILQVTSAAPDNAKEDSKNEVQSIEKEAKLKVLRVSEIETALDKISKDAVKEKDVKWKVCLDDYIGTFKGVAVSAIKCGSKIEELILAGKAEEAKNQLILLRGLTESAEKTMTESQSCERQLTRVDSEVSVIKEVNIKVTGSVADETVNDSMGLGFSDEFVADSDKSIVSGTDLADAGGADSSDVNNESPGSSGEEAVSEEISGIIDPPDVVDVSPTK